MTLTKNRLAALRHALYDLERPIIRMYPPSSTWWASFKLLQKVIGKHNEKTCPFCVPVSVVVE